MASLIVKPIKTPAIFEKERTFFLIQSHYHPDNKIGYGIYIPREKVDYSVFISEIGKLWGGDDAVAVFNIRLR